MNFDIDDSSPEFRREVAAFLDEHVTRRTDRAVPSDRAPTTTGTSTGRSVLGGGSPVDGRPSTAAEGTTAPSRCSSSPTSWSGGGSPPTGSA